MTIKDKNELKLIEVAIASIIESKNPENRLLLESEIETYCINYCNLLYPNLDKEDLHEIIKLLNERFQFKLNPGTLIAEVDRVPWYKAFKETNNCVYFDRYKEYLERDKGFNANDIKTLDNDILDSIMDYLGNPNDSYFEPRRGLVMGDVQSGKTSTYTGLICKAADSGYKAIIVLTGMVESLRQQTQRRLDEGFVGFDSDHMQKMDFNQQWIGVGKYSKKKGVVLTSRSSDFVSSTAKNLGFSLDSFNDTVLFVVKKNVSVLNKLIKWLKDLNTSENDKQIDVPMLLIDDEADNASINTKPDDDENPTKINDCIRRLLNTFRLNNYVGFTATPFANVFINPEIYEDLFPKDFIYSLTSPKGYIGPQNIFLDGANYSDCLLNNSDCEEILPLKHKRYQSFTKIPSTLEDAIHSYMITNVIRDLRGDIDSHRGMLINISRFNSPQEEIGEVVSSYVSNIISKYKLYCETPIFSNDQNDINITKKIFYKYYSSCEFKWEEILTHLYDSNKNIECVVVNKDSKMVDYEEYKHGARLIVIGGLSLSRGLTIEGLCISYLYRTTQTYDVLLQMGRWFGYRKGYEDLFKIWMPKYLMSCYQDIAQSIEELKIDLEEMKESKKTPKEFGIRIRNDKTCLRITAANKMRNATGVDEVVSLFGDFEDTGVILKDAASNIHNYNLIESKLISLNKNGYKFVRDDNSNLVIRNVPKKYIIDIIKDYTADSNNRTFNSKNLSSFLSICNEPELDLIDIGLVEGSRSSEKNLINFANIDIHMPEKQFSVDERSIYINKSRKLLINPYDATYGLSKTIKEECEKQYLKYRAIANPNKEINIKGFSIKTYLRTKKRNAMLLIYLVKLKPDKIEDGKNVSLTTIRYLEEQNAIPVGLGLIIPQYTDKYREIHRYQTNLIEQQNILRKQYEEDLYYD